MSAHNVVAIRNGGNDALRAAYADDGFTFTAVAMPTFNNGSGGSWVSVAYAPEIDTLVAIMSGSVAGNPTLGPFAYSTDGGASWTATAANLLDPTWNDICWANSLALFLAVAGDGTNRVATSPDGITWTSHALGATADLRCVAWSEDLGVAVAAGASNAIYHSTDGSTWTVAGTLPGTSKTWRSCVWAGGAIQKFCMSASSGGGSNDFAYSVDGDVWAQRNLTGTAYVWGRIAYSPTLDYVAVIGGNTGVFAYTNDPSAGFTQIATGIGSTDFEGICYSRILGLWILTNATNVYTAPDNTTWTSHSSPANGVQNGVVALDPAPATSLGQAAKAGAYWLIGP